MVAGFATHVALHALFVRVPCERLGPHQTMSSSNQPNTTLYIKNLNDKVNKNELRSQLFALFTTYGKIIDIVASKSRSTRGQAFLVFTDLAGATSAMRACEGMLFYDKPLVSYLNLKFIYAI